MSKLLQINLRDAAAGELEKLAMTQGSTKTQVARQLIYEGLRARGRDPVGQESESSQLAQVAS